MSNGYTERRPAYALALEWIDEMQANDYGRERMARSLANLLDRYRDRARESDKRYYQSGRRNLKPKESDAETEPGLSGTEAVEQKPESTGGSEAPDVGVERGTEDQEHPTRGG